MKTIGWILILASVIIARAGLKGRILDLGTDMSDFFLDLADGDIKGMTEVLQRTGDATTPSMSQTVTNSNGDPNGHIRTSGQIGKAAIEFGTAAKGYRFGSTGPDWYDCSGLMYRSCQKAVAYKGMRFTTFTIGTNKFFEEIPWKNLTNSPKDAIVVWPTHHMGVVTGPDEFYSARSVKTGIGYSKITTFEPSYGKPRFYTVKSPPSQEARGGEQGPRG